MKATVRNILMVAGVAGALFLADHHSSGFSYFQVGGQAVVWPGGQSIRELSPSTFPAGSDAETLIRNAMGLWNIVPATGFEYFYARLDQDYPIDHFDGFNDTAAVPNDQLDPGVLAVTYMVNDGAEWFDMDILFSAFPGGVGYTFDPNPPCDVVAAPVPDNGFSFLLIATHELGHGVGLGHDPIGDEPPGTPWLVATMNPRYPGGGPIGQEHIVELHTDDRNALRFLYPPSGPPDPPLIDLASAAYGTGDTVGQAAPLSLEPSTLFPGEQLSVQSLIENFGTASALSVRQGFYLSTDGVIDTDDQFLGGLFWDLAFQDALEFGVIIDLPADLPAGAYYIGSILDDQNQVTEAYEDNNAVAYCGAVTVAQLAPVIHPLVQQATPCGQPYTGPTPSVTHPLNMAPIAWSLENAPSGMTIDPMTGVVHWPDPMPSPFLYAVVIRATNDAGSSTAMLFLGVNTAPPEMAAVADHHASCQPVYEGPTPQLLSPACMKPILFWSLDTAPAGMTLDAETGVVSWLNPRPSPIPYPVTIRATNTAGTGTTTWFLHVTAGDLNGDAVLSLSDFHVLHDCVSGPANPAADGCSCADVDLDGDIDLFDLSSFQNALSY